MVRATAIIDPNYGDSGKGILTDYFSTPESIVIRYNGGAQAGHTVVSNGTNGNGIRHVFSHFGAGTLQGANTFLSKFFIVNPFLFSKEWAELQEKGINLNGRVFADWNCLVTTPFDIAINQVLEKRRGANRHGSCGVGINETVTRSRRNNLAFEFTVSDIFCGLYSRLKEIEREWLPKRLEELEIDRSEIQMAFDSNDRFLESCEFFIDNVKDWIFNEKWEEIIFEGAQGLRLDEDRLEEWPHVTRSKTGLDNILYLSKQMKIDSLDVYYVSRPYLTRHGAGNLDMEIPYAIGKEQTNVTNEYQGRFRYAALDFKELSRVIHQDLAKARNTGITINPGLVFTHIDEVGVFFENLIPSIEKILGIPVKYLSKGPTREHVYAQNRFPSLC